MRSPSVPQPPSGSPPGADRRGSLVASAGGADFDLLPFLDLGDPEESEDNSGRMYC